MNNSDATHPDVIVGELALVNGQHQTDVAHMALLTPPRRARGDRHSETLLVFLDLGRGGASGLARAMLDRFSRTYWRCPGPVTSALRQAINAANAHLREENRLMPVSQRQRAGLACAVLREDRVYVAHIGPAKVFLARGEQVRRYTTQPEDGLPLGVSSGLDIRFAHSLVSEGDRLLLTGESWTGGLPDSALAEALRAEDVTDIMLKLEHRVASKSLSALVVEYPSGEEPYAPAYQTEERLPPAVALPTSPEMVQQEPLEPVFESTRGTQAAFEPLESDELSRLDAASLVSEGVAYDDVLGEPVQPDERWRRSRPLLGFSFGRKWLDQSRRGLRRVSSALGSGARTALTRVLPEPEPTPSRRQRRARESSPQNVPMMAGIAVAIPLLVAFLVVTVYLQRGDTERRGSLVQQAREALAAAQQADPGDARALWYATLQVAEDALLIVPGDEEILAIRDQAHSHLDELETVVRPKLTALGNYEEGQGRRLAATRAQVYVLDTTQNEVKQQTLDRSGQDFNAGQPSLVTYRDHSVGDGPIGGMRDVVWLSAAGPWTSDALLILTEDNRLLQHDPTWGLSWVPFESDLSPANVRVLRSYDGRLYALDPVQSEVWRFPYTGSGFGPPERYFRVPVPDLSGAIDMTIDGAVYILLADGKIYKFFGGESEPYDIKGLPQELSRPVALVSEGDMTRGALYVADAGSQSIVALTKDGQFINQFKAADDTLANMEALAIDEDSRTLFVLASGQLYGMALPPLPEPSGGSE